MHDTPYIVDQRALDALCAKLRADGVFAFDSEFIRDETYDANLCLVQVASSDGRVTLIDPTAGLEMAGFWSLVTAPDVITIVHAGKEDFEVCLRATGQAPRNVFDVQIGCGLLGYGYPLSLTRLVESTMGKRIAKAQTLTDWLRRPLTEEQLRYAVEDVAHLHEIYEKLSRELAKKDRKPWADEEMRRFEDPTYYRPPAEDRLFRLKGSRRLDGLGLVTLEKLIEWRDAWAQEKNRPIRALIRDDVLVEIARRRPRRATELQVLRGFPQAKNPRIIAELIERIQDAAKTPKSEWPQPFEGRKETPMMRVTTDLLSAMCEAICYEESVSRELLGSTERLRELLDYHVATDEGDPPPLLRGWRRDFIGTRLIDFLSGRTELHLQGWPKKPHLRIVSHR